MGTHSTHLYHVVERFLILGPEHLPDVQHVDLAARHHDADQRVVSRAQTLQWSNPHIKPGMAKQPCSAHHMWDPLSDFYPALGLKE